MGTFVVCVARSTAVAGWMAVAARARSTAMDRLAAVTTPTSRTSVVAAPAAPASLKPSVSMASSVDGLGVGIGQSWRVWAVQQDPSSEIEPGIVDAIDRLASKTSVRGGNHPRNAGVDLGLAQKGRP